MDSNKLVRLEVSGLLGTYSYDLTFPVDAATSVRFITGPNGYGKTTVLFLIYSLFNQKFENFSAVEFGSLKFVFQDGKSIEMKQVLRLKEETDANNGSDLPEKIYSKLLEVCYRHGDGRLLDSVVYDLGVRFNDDFNEDFAQKVHDANLRLFLNSQECYWIDESRMINKSRVSLDRNVDAEFSTMVRRSREMAEEYGRVKPFFIEGLTVREGLKDKELADSKRFVKNLELFKELIGSYDFDRKLLETVPKYEGIRFRLNDKKKSIVLPENLSSGEQQLVDIFYELVFNAPEDSLVLIDEPETSQHLMWQVKFCDNITKVAVNKNLQIVVATHSPQIFDGKWNLSEDLYDQAHRKR